MGNRWNWSEPHVAVIVVAIVVLVISAIAVPYLHAQYRQNDAAKTIAAQPAEAAAEQVQEPAPKEPEPEILASGKFAKVEYITGGGPGTNYHCTVITFEDSTNFIIYQNFVRMPLPKGTVIQVFIKNGEGWVIREAK